MRTSAAAPLSDVTFDIAPGEVLGLAGLVGSGRTSVLQQIFGLHRSSGGSVTLDGQTLRRHDTNETVRLGMAMVPEDRNDLGLILNRSIRENITLAHLRRFRALAALPVPSRRQERKAARHQMVSLGVRASGDQQRVRELSGGNAQKVLISRWLCAEPPRVLLLDEPTKGVDAGGKSDIYRIIADLADRGTSVVVVSSDLEELSAICHRAVVVVEGRTVTELPAPLSEQQILSACYGAIERHHNALIASAERSRQ